MNCAFDDIVQDGLGKDLRVYEMQRSIRGGLERPLFGYMVVVNESD